MSSKIRCIELAKSLGKAKNAADESSVLSILESLEEIEMTISLLKSTNLGKLVNSITKSVAFKHASDVQSAAKRLVAKWKEMVASRRPRNGKRKKTERLKDVSVTPQPPCPKNEALSTAESTGYLRPEYDWRTGDSRRDKMISKFISVLKPAVDREEYCCFQRVSADIEEELGALHGSNSEQYIAKYRDLHFNLKRNGELVMEVLSGHIGASKLVQMSSEELADNRLKEKRDRDKKWAMEEARNDHALNVSQAMTDEYKCGKCKMRKCKYSQAQTRAADEPMTTFITCLNCGNRWKM